MSAPPLTSKADPPPRPPANTKGRRRRPKPARRAARRLADTAGPDPVTAPEQVRLVVGTLGAPHGVSGDLRLHLTTDDLEHLQSVRRVYLDGEQRGRRVVDLRPHGDGALIQFHGVDTPEAAAALTGRVVRIAGSDARPLAPGEFFLYQLIGLRVEDESGTELGTVTDLLETGANDVVVITPSTGGSDMLLPNIPEVIVEINPADGRMVARPPAYYGDEGD
jgi:16S rRNA processing protein RimM